MVHLRIMLRDVRSEVASGKQADKICGRLLPDAVKPLVAGQTRLTLALDDAPTQRYGPYVQVAGIHHNPTPGPAGSPQVYGHIWVLLGLLSVHPAWGWSRAKDPDLFISSRSARYPGLKPA
jgi:hypothetical protein